MTGPRHLWSGDWQRESAASAEELAERSDPAEQVESPMPEPAPAGPSALDRLRIALRENPRRVRRVALVGVAGLAAIGVALGAVAAVTSSDRPAPAPAQRVSAASGGHVWLGVDATSFPVTPGAMIVDVAPGSPADTAGLQPGEVITAIGNHPVQTPTDLGSALDGLRAGQQVQIAYQLAPGQSTYTTTATLQPPPAGP